MQVAVRHASATADCASILRIEPSEPGVPARREPVTPFVRLAAIDDSPSRRLKPAAPWVYAYGNNFGLFGVGFAFILSERLRNPRYHK